MNITPSEIGKLHYSVVVEVSQNDIAADTNATFKKYQRDANIPGFRKGKVPMGVVKKMIGKSVISQEVYTFANKELKLWAKEEKGWNLLGQPLPLDPEEEEWKEQEFYRVPFEIGIYDTPKVELTEKDKIPKYRIQVKDEEVEDYLRQLQRNHSTTENIENITEECFSIIIDVKELDENGQPKLGGISMEEGHVWNLEKLLTAKGQKEFIGKRVGDEWELPLRKYFENETDFALMLKLKKEDLPDPKTRFSCKIQSAQKRLFPELNKDFFQTILGKENTVETEAEFRAKLQSLIREEYDRLSESRIAKDIMEYLLKRVKLQLPVDFILKLAKEQREEGRKEMGQEEVENILHATKWQILSGELAKQWNLEVEENDVKRQLFAIAIEPYKNIGLSIDSLPEGIIKDRMEEVMSNRSLMHQAEMRALENLVFMKAKEKVKYKDKDISFEDFKKL